MRGIMANIITTKGVKRGFPIVGGETFWGLKGIDLEIPEGKLTILKGRSGSGKTTLLNILSALDYPTEGEVWFRDKDLAKLSDRQRDRIRREQFGFIFQSVALVPMLTAYENVEFSLRLAKYGDNWNRRAQECLRLVGLGSRLNHMPQEMSGGEQQRVAIARAIAHKPKIIFADEPTAELDTNTGLQVMKIFKELIESEGLTIVMTTHDTELMKLGDRVYQLEEGELVE